MDDITVAWEQCPISKAPYLNGFGLYNVYDVSFSRPDQSVSFILLIGNDSHLTKEVILYDVSFAIADLDEVKTFKQWCETLNNHPQTSGDRCSLEMGDREYLHKRFTYLMGLKQTMQSFFGERYDELVDYWFAYVSGV